MNSIGMNIRRLRKAHGLTQVELAKRLAATQKVVTSYENNQRTPTLEKLEKLSQIFAVTIDEIVGKKELIVESKQSHLHGNRRAARVQELFEKLPPGRTLKDMMQIGRFTDLQASKIMLQLLDIVEQLHNAGIYHWDIKPSNIWITQDGEVILFDFDTTFSSKKEFNDRFLINMGTYSWASLRRIHEEQSLRNFNPKTNTNPIIPTTPMAWNISSKLMLYTTAPS